MNNTETKNVVISGGMGYLGKDIALELSKAGMSIILLYHSTPKDEVEAFLLTLIGTGHKAFACDLLNEEEVHESFAKIESEIGKVHSYIHAAGIKPQRKTLISTSTQEMKEQFDANFYTGFNFLKEASIKLKEQKSGVLISITTIGILQPKSCRSLGGYIPAKFALQGALTMLREELESSNVRVYSIAPGFMSGGMNSEIPEAFKMIAAKSNDSQRITNPKDVAEKILYLFNNSSTETELTYPVAEEYTTQHAV